MYYQNASLFITQPYTYNTPLQIISLPPKYFHIDFIIIYILFEHNKYINVKLEFHFTIHIKIAFDV